MPLGVEAAAWNPEYSRSGSYEGKPPVPFVDDIVKVERMRQLIEILGRSEAIASWDLYRQAGPSVRTMTSRLWKAEDKGQDRRSRS